jgi:hypothetical protein
MKIIEQSLENLMHIPYLYMQLDHKLLEIIILRLNISFILIKNNPKKQYKINVSILHSY